MSLHQKNLHKHAKVLQKFRIDTSLKSTEDLLRRMMCLPKTQQNQEQRRLYEMKSAVNKKPSEFKTRPECNDDDQVDALLESIENLDKILANIGSGQKEKVIEQMATKFGLFEKETETADVGYANR